MKPISGRKFLTVMAGLVFAYGAVTKHIPPEAIASIVTMVFVSYFNKEKNKNGLDKVPKE